MRRFIVAWGLLVQLSAMAQSLTLEDIFLHGTYREKRPENLRFLADDRFYTEQVHAAVVRKETETGRTVDTVTSQTDTLFGHRFQLFDYAFSSDERLLLLAGNRKARYRRSYVADYVVASRGKGISDPLVYLPACSYATLSPDGRFVAFVRQNNLYYTDLLTRNEVAVTTDGKPNEIIEGSTDWVYEEEFEFTKAFAWSPNSTYLAYYRFDETKVPEYNMQKWEGLYPTDYRFKYPKAGEANAKVEIWVHALSSNTSQKVPLDSASAHYIPHLQWSNMADALVLQTLNRYQTLLRYWWYDAHSATLKGFYGEHATPIEVNDRLFFFGRKDQFVTTSEKEGSNKTALVLSPHHTSCVFCENQISLRKTIESLEDLQGDWLYYTYAPQPMDRSVERIHLRTGQTQALGEQRGHSSLQVSSQGRYYLLSHHAAGQPATVTLYHAATRKPIRVLEDNAGLKAKLAALHLPPQRFFQFSTPDKVELHGWQLLPPAFDSTRKYPVILYTYGGPGSNMVTNAWTGTTYLWHHYLAAQGFVVVCVDGRGTGGRGTAFRTSTYKQLGALETRDQIATARYMAAQPFVDSLRIGIWGWSFGGFLSTNSLLQGNGLFKAAIAVAPVTDWRFYDTIYSERYLSTPQDNASGYYQQSPLHHAHLLRGEYLLIHGTADDNVHFQHSLAMQEALIKAGKQFQTFVYPNKAHGISGGNTRLHLYTLMANFWKEKLK